MKTFGKILALIPAGAVAALVIYLVMHLTCSPGFIKFIDMHRALLDALGG